MVQIPKDLVCVLESCTDILLVEVTHEVVSPFECGVDLILRQVAHEFVNLAKHLFAINVL